MKTPITIPINAEENARIETIRREAFTAELQGYGFAQSIIDLLIRFDFEHCGTASDRDGDQHIFRVRNLIMPVVMTLTPAARDFDLLEAILQSGRDSLRDELAPAYQTIHRWLSRPSGVFKHRSEPNAQDQTREPKTSI